MYVSEDLVSSPSLLVGLSIICGVPLEVHHCTPMLTGVLAGHATWGKEREGRKRIIEEG